MTATPISQRDAPRAYTERTTCRACGSGALLPAFSLGTQCVSDFIEPNQVQRPTGYSGCPIDVVVCQGCTLVQLRHTARQDLLYTRRYWYRSGVTDTMRRQLREVVDAAVRRVDLKPGDVVLDIGANDGTLLAQYQDIPGVHGLVRVAVEPAVNLHDECLKHCDVLVKDFWSENAYFRAVPNHVAEYEADVQNPRFGLPKRWHRQPKIITAAGMLYDLEDPGAFIRDVARVLHPQGVFVAQLMCLANMLRMGDVGNLCHEHLEFYTLHSLDLLLAKHGLVIQDIETVPVNGESYRLWIVHKDSLPGMADKAAERRVLDAMYAERDIHAVPDLKRWFAAQQDKRDRTMRWLRSQKMQGKTIAILGASTKGNVILQWYGLTSDIVSHASDRSPQKWGKVTVGGGVPIVSEEESRRRKPDICVLIIYSFLEEVLEREAAWMQAGGQVLVPLPEPRVISLSWNETVGQWQRKVVVL